MAEILKDVLYAGDWTLPDGRVFHCPPKHIPHYAKRLKDMRAAGFHIPVSWEHQDSMDPMVDKDYQKAIKKAGKARLALGHAVDATNTSSCVEVKMEVPDIEDRKQLPKARFVSPTIKWDYKDSTGRVWPGPSITDIAVVAQPIQHTQKPFALGVSPKVDDPIQLSMTGFKPVQLGADVAKDKAKETEELPPDIGEEEDDEVDAETETATPAPAPELENVESIAKKLKGALEALAGHNLILGSDIPEDFEQFLDRLIAACKTKSAGESAANPPASETPNLDRANEVNAPVMMGAAQTKREREHMKLRLDVLWMKKKINKPLYDKLLAELNTVSLSATTDGEIVQTGLVARIAAYEELDENASAFIAKLGVNGAEETPSPAEADKVGAIERQEKAGAALAQLATGKKKKSA